MANPKLVVIVGETASGKSAVALQLAKRFDGEIISADSWQVYKSFNIGTAKPLEDEQAAIKHHLIDIREAPEGFSAAIYKDLAKVAITNIAKRGKLPIMVGGTGLYVDSVLFNFSFMAQGSPAERAKLQTKSIDALLTMIKQKQIDLTAIDTRNKRRLIRLLETGGARPTSSSLRPNTLVLGIKIPRAQLRTNIEKRVEIMFRRGLKREVAELAAKYGWEVEPMKGIGYREFKAYFDGTQSLAATKRKIVKSTLDLAKRQRTWFKRNHSIVWMESAAEAQKLVTNFLKTV